MESESAVKKIPLNGNAETTSQKAETTSQKKVEANRRNAQLSTGPTSAEGKKTSSRNASKHGLLTRTLSSLLTITRRIRLNLTACSPRCGIATAQSALRRTC